MPRSAADFAIALGLLLRLHGAVEIRTITFHAFRFTLHASRFPPHSGG